MLDPAPAPAPEVNQMAKTQKANASEPEREGNRYTRAARVLAKDDSIDVKTLADRAFMSETTAARCLEAWHARHVRSIALVPGRPSEDRSVVQLRELRSACANGSSVAGDPRDCERGAGRPEGARRWSSPSSIPSHALSRE